MMQIIAILVGLLVAAAFFGLSMIIIEKGRGSIGAFVYAAFVMIFGVVVAFTTYVWMSPP